MANITQLESVQKWAANIYLWIYNFGGLNTN